MLQRHWSNDIFNLIFNLSHEQKLKKNWEKPIAMVAWDLWDLHPMIRPLCWRAICSKVWDPNHSHVI